MTIFMSWLGQLSGSFQLSVKIIHVVLATCWVWAMHDDNAVVGKEAFLSQSAQSAVDQTPLDQALLPFPHHYKSCAQLVCTAAAVVVYPGYFRTELLFQQTPFALQCQNYQLSIRQIVLECFRRN